MEINSSHGESTLVAHLSKKDLEFFRKNPFGNVATKPNNKGVRIIFSLGKEISSSIKGSIVSLIATKESLNYLSKGGDDIFFAIISKNTFNILAIEVYLEMS